MEWPATLLLYGSLEVHLLLSLYYSCLGLGPLYPGLALKSWVCVGVLLRLWFCARASVCVCVCVRECVCVCVRLSVCLSIWMINSVRILGQPHAEM
jgi:hypothetical protein